MFFLIQLFSQIVERLQNVSSDWQNKVLLKEENIRAELKARRLILFDERRLSEKVVNILKSIFSMYERYNANDNGMEETGLGLEYTAAARLWYRCGLRLANLDSLMGPRYTNRKVVFQDFFELVEKVVAEDYVVAPSVFSFKERSDAFCQVSLCGSVYFSHPKSRLTTFWNRLEIKSNLLRISKNISMNLADHFVLAREE
jgi:hypothetical protein